jgi:hypothetical protein
MTVNIPHTSIFGDADLFPASPKGCARMRFTVAHPGAPTRTMMGVGQ